jgi:hypothetical protein
MVNHHPCTNHKLKTKHYPMTLKQKTLSSVFKCVSCVLLLVGAAAHAQSSGSNPAGTWTWTTPGRNGGPDRTNTLTLKIEDAKLTGKISAPGRGGQASETPITDGKVDGDTVSFAVVREFNGTSTTTKYSGKISADKITGKIELTRNGESQSRDWTASRSTDTK